MTDADVPDVLVCAPPIPDAWRARLSELRARLEEDATYAAHTNHAAVRALGTDAALFRYLRARGGDVAKAHALLAKSCAWLLEKRPWAVDQALLEVEMRTGKFYCTGKRDRWGRPIIVLDNTVQNTRALGGQMDGLIFVLQRAVRLMQPPVEKYVVFMNLANFAMKNNPPWAATKETLSTLQEQLPERLGHVILYQTPWIFQTLFKLVKPLLDPITVAKVIFINGNDGDGTANDRRMRAVLGDNWRSLCSAGASSVHPKSSPGYDHAAVWPTVIDDHIRFCRDDGAPLSDVEERTLRDRAALVAKGHEHWPPAPEGYLNDTYAALEADTTRSGRTRGQKAKKKANKNEVVRGEADSQDESTMSEQLSSRKSGWFSW